MKKSYKLLVSYSNFYLGDYFEGDVEYTDLKSVFNAYLSDRKTNRDLNKCKLVSEPIAYYRIRLYEESDNEIYFSDYKIIHHKNGKISFRRSDVE